MPALDPETFGHLLHGTARAWRIKLDARLKPMGMSQAKWRTLLHLSIAPGPLTQAEVAARLGIEEPTLVALLHRLERGGWVARRSAAHDRRCKTVHLGRRAHRIIAQINDTAAELRHQLLADVSSPDLQACMRVLNRVRAKLEKRESPPARTIAAPPLARNQLRQVGNGSAITKKGVTRRRNGASK